MTNPKDDKKLPPIMQKLESFAWKMHHRIERIAHPKRDFHLLGFTPYREGKISYVGFNDRMVASTIDTLISSLLLFKLLSVLAALFFGKDRAYLLYNIPVGATKEDMLYLTQQEHFMRDWVLNNMLYIIVLAIPIIGSWIYASTTPGKWLFQMRVVDATTGKPLSVRQSFLRYLGYILCTLSCFLGFLWIIKDKRKQGWHDKLANTVVIRVKGWRLPKPNESAFPQEPIPENAPEQMPSPTPEAST